MLKRLPVGTDDFSKVIRENYYYIDKSLLIKEIIDSGSEATLIPRPRRFGKSLNLSMLKCFFEKTETSNTDLFVNLAIAQHPEAMVHQGQYPVVFFTFKFVEGDTWEEAFDGIKMIIAEEFRRHRYLLSGTLLDKIQKRNFEKIINQTAGKQLYKSSLRHLVEYLAQYHNQKPIVLIDEYDVPLQVSFKNKYYKEAVSFIKLFFGDGVKGNHSLHFAIFTGALRVAKESIFTGMNNLETCTFINELYSDKFGLLEDEVKDIMAYYSIPTSIDEVRSWYNGYTSGSCTVYNPWSIVNFVKQKGELQSYWVNTSSNDIIQDIIMRSGEDIKRDLGTLIAGGTIQKPINENIIYADVERQSDVLWNFLLFTGYLTFKNRTLIRKKMHADFCIPNDEVASFYETTISSWFQQSGTEPIYNAMLQSLMAEDMPTFKELFYDFTLTAFSAFDMSGDHPESFYHAFVLGLLVSLSDRYEITSNRESGIGRYDVTLVPKAVNKAGFIFEFKKINARSSETLEEAARRAVQQIEDRHYAQAMRARGVTKVVALGIAFSGKKVLINDKVL